MLPPVLISFISLAPTAKEGLHKQTTTHRFPQGAEAVCHRTDFSTALSSVSDVEVLDLAVCCSKLFRQGAVKGGYHLMFYVHRNNKKPIMEANKVLEVILHTPLLFFFFFLISSASLIHWDKSNFTQGRSHSG